MKFNLYSIVYTHIYIYLFLIFNLISNREVWLDVIIED